MAKKEAQWQSNFYQTVSEKIGLRKRKIDPIKRRNGQLPEGRGATPFSRKEGGKKKFAGKGETEKR